VAVTAFERIIGLQPMPFPLRQHSTFALEFFRCINTTENPTPNFFRCLHFPRDFIGPVVRYMTVRADCSHAGAVCIVNGSLQLFKRISLHFVTTDAECFSVGSFQCCIKCTPEDNTGDKSADSQQSQTDMGRGPIEYLPVQFDRLPHGLSC